MIQCPICGMLCAPEHVDTHDDRFVALARATEGVAKARAALVAAYAALVAAQLNMPVPGNAAEQWTQDRADSALVGGQS